MHESTWERYGAASGLVFVVLLLLSTFTVPAPPHIDASSSSILAYFSGHSMALLTTGVFMMFAVLAFLWFLGHLRHVMQRAEGGAEALSPIVFVAGAVLAAVAVIGQVPMITLAFMVHKGDATSTSVVRMLYDMTQVTGSFVTIALGLFVAAASLAMVRKEIVAAWLGWAGLALAVVTLVGGAVTLYATSYSAATSVVGFYIPLVGFAVWVAVASISMLQRPEVVRQPAVGHAPFFAG